MPIDQDKVLTIVKMRGPVLPAQIAREIGTNILFASAVLSEIASSGKIKISSLKVGGSPLYYAPEHAHRLQQFAGHLHEKEKKAYDILQASKVIRDRDAEPVVRVALRNIPDFAAPLNVTVNGETEIFWKWSASSNEEIEPAIKKMLGIAEPNPELPKAAEPEKPKTEPAQEKHRDEPVQELQKTAEKEKNIKKEEQIHEKKAKTDQKPSEFFQKVQNYLGKNGISLIEQALVRKEREFDLTIQFDSVFGALTYYCKAKDKAKVTDLDLSAAYVQGQMKKLPVIFLSRGELTKKAKEMLGKEFKTIVFKRI